MKNKDEFKDILGFFSNLAGKREFLSWEDFRKDPKNRVVLGKGLSQFLCGESFEKSMTPYSAILKDSTLQVFSFYGFSNLNKSKMYSIGSDVFTIIEEKGKGIQSVQVETEKGTFNFALALNLFTLEKVGKVIQTKDSLILDAVKGNEIRNLEFELMDFWARLYKVQLEPIDFLTNQHNEKLFNVWFSELKEEGRSRFSTEETRTTMAQFLNQTRKAA